MNLLVKLGRKLWPFGKKERPQLVIPVPEIGPKPPKPLKGERCLNFELGAPDWPRYREKLWFFAYVSDDGTPTSGQHFMITREEITT